MKANSQTTLQVAGMTCRSCISHINQALGELDGVKEVTVKMREGQVLVEHDSEKVFAPQLIAALNDAGYEGQIVS